MLTFLRDGAKKGLMKFILFGFLIMAGGGLVLMDVGNFFRDGVNPGEEVMVVGNEKVTLVEFSTMLNRALARQGIDAATAYELGLIDQMVNSEISSSLIRQSARDMGIIVSDELVAHQIAQLLRPYDQEGMSKEQAFNNILRSQGMSEAVFVQTLKQQMTNAILRSAILSSTAWSSEQEVRDLYKFQHEQRDIQGVFFPHDNVTDYGEPTDEVLLPLYQAGQEKYAVPETREFTMAIISHDNIKDSIEITDDELRSIYESEIDSFAIAETRVLEQSVMESQTEAMAVAGKMNDGGLNMEEAVADVTGSNDAYLGADEFQQGGLYEQIADTAFGAAQIGDVIGPFETPLGWHVLKLEEIIEPRTKDFADVKEQLEQEVMQDELSNQMYEFANALDTQIAEGATIEQVAEEFDLEVKSYGPLRDDGSTPDDKEGFEGFEQDRSYILEMVFELLETETAPVMELADGRFALIRVDEITEKSYKPFDEVKGNLANIWVRDQQQVLNKLNVQSALQALVSGETDLEELAAQNNLPVKSYNALTRIDEAPEGLSGTAKTKFFDLPEGEFTVTSAQDGYFVGTVTDVRLPEIAQASEEDMAQIRETSTQGSMDEFMLLYLENERKSRTVKINQNAIARYFGPGSEQNLY